MQKKLSQKLNEYYTFIHMNLNIEKIHQLLL